VILSIKEVIAREEEMMTWFQVKNTRKVIPMVASRYSEAAHAPSARSAFLLFAVLSFLPACSSGGKLRAAAISGSNGSALDQSLEEKSAQPPDPVHPASGESVSLLLAKLDKVTKASESEVVQYFQAKCVACHGAGAANASLWTLDFEGLNRNVIITDPQASTVYQTLVNAVERRMKPAPMPFGANFEASPEEETKHLRVLKWYLEDAAEVAVAAWLDFRQFNPFGDDTEIKFSYQCKTPVSFRAFLTRMSLDAFERLPTKAELESFGDVSLDAPVTPELRQSASRRLLSDPRWRGEFLSKGFRRFASKLSGAADIRKSAVANEKPSGTAGIPDALKAGLTQEEADHLKEEFYQILLGNIDPNTGRERKKYQDILLGNEVFVSDVTKNLYGCSGKPEQGKWIPCDMNQASGSNLRQSYFTSFSYLSSLPTSVLIDNNNYARTSALYHFIRGVPLKAATDGEKGGTVAPLPTCLKSKDTRGHQAGGTFSPIGTIQIPLAGNVCQTCHIDRNLANGSIVFRPFGSWGQSLTSGDLTTHGEAIPGVSEALKVQRRSTTEPNDKDKVTNVDLNFLKSLMPNASGVFDGEAACLVIDGEQKELTNVKDLAEFLIGDGRSLGAGMARHIPRSISNLGSTNLELINLMERKFMESDGRVLPLFEAYFSSETYSCRNQE
jgi:mono/diheme cytochrome c family protein